MRPAQKGQWQLQVAMVFKTLILFSYTHNVYPKKGNTIHLWLLNCKFKNKVKEIRLSELMRRVTMAQKER